MPDELLARLQHFHTDAFPACQETFQSLVNDGQHPTTLFIGCSDSRVAPYLLNGAGPGELFLVRNVGGFVPPFDGSAGYHGAAAAIEFAVLSLSVQRIVVCGHSHCGAIRALYGDAPAEAHWGWGKRPCCPSPTLGPRYCAAQNSGQSFCSSNA